MGYAQVILHSNVLCFRAHQMYAQICCLSLSLFSVTAPFERKMEMARDQKKQEEDETESVRLAKN